MPTDSIFLYMNRVSFSSLDSSSMSVFLTSGVKSIRSLIRPAASSLLLGGYSIDYSLGGFRSFLATKLVLSTPVDSFSSFGVS